MADLQSSPVRQPGAWRREPLQVQQGGAKVLHRLHEHAPNPTQLVGFLTLIVSGGILLLLTGLTVIGLVMGLIVFTPLLLISSPIWIPAGIVLFIGIAWTLSMCGFAVAVLSAMSWLYRCLKGFNPLGSSRVDNERSQISNTTSHIKDYARGYAGYWQSKVKDAAPSA